MKLPISPPYLPMEAKLTSEIPLGPEWEYEPKWDGFRCIAFCDGKEVALQSKSGSVLTRYFPEVVHALAQIEAARFVIDGELTVSVDGALSFDALLQRIHPAESRVTLLARKTPAHLVVFDLLVDENGSELFLRPLEERRVSLERFHRTFLGATETFELSPFTRDPATARQWLGNAHGNTDGVIAKRVDQPYLSGERAMVKVKNIRTADCVVGGFRYASKSNEVGSLLLGLYDTDGLLTHVGYTSSIPAAERKALTHKLEKLIAPPGFEKRPPGGPSRWSTERSAAWEPLKPKLVVEVSFDHVTGDRFRHGTRLLRWRPDKDPKQCTMQQLESPG